jgi:hypothetical protein
MKAMQPDQMKAKGFPRFHFRTKTEPFDRLRT